MTKDELAMFKTWVLETDPVLFEQNPFRCIGSYLGNFNGWVQLRKLIPNERVFQGGAT